MMKCAVLLRVFSLPNQSKAFRKGTVFFLLPPFSTGCAKMVGFPYAHKSRAFALKHGAASRNTLSGLLGLSISRPGKRTKRSEEHTSELQSHLNLVCRLLLEKKK